MVLWSYKNLDNKNLWAELFPITVCMTVFIYPLSNQYHSAYDLFKTQPEKCLMTVGNKDYNNRLQSLISISTHLFEKMCLNTMQCHRIATYIGLVLSYYVYTIFLVNMGLALRLGTRILQRQLSTLPLRPCIVALIL